MPRSLKLLGQDKLQLTLPPKRWIRWLLLISAHLQTRHSPIHGKEQKVSTFTCSVKDSCTKKTTTEPWRLRCVLLSTKKSFKPKMFTLLWRSLHFSTAAIESAAGLLSNWRDLKLFPNKNERHTSCWLSTFSPEILLTTRRKLNLLVRSATTRLTNSKYLPL